MNSLLLLITTCSLLSCGLCFELKIRNGRPFGKDAYLCSAMEMPSDETLYLTEFKKTNSTTNAHHMIVMSCDYPVYTKSSWNCKSQRICKDEENFIFSWAMDAPGFKLPHETSVKVGKGAPNTKYLILQVHYKDLRKLNKNEKFLDNSGLEITAQKTPTKRNTGILLSVTGGYIPAKSLIYSDAMCEMKPKCLLKPIAFRVHAHRLCDLISLFRIRDGNWTKLGAQSPKKPQTFYPIEDSGLNIRAGDLIATRCVMNNTDNNNTVYIGNNAMDEMCNSYLLYSYPAEKNPQMNKVCESNGFPEFSWNDFFTEDQIPIESKQNLENGKIMEEDYEEEDENDLFQSNFLGF